MTIPVLQEMKRQGRKIVGVVAYDYQMAQIVDRAGVDIVSAGDSVGVTLWGQRTDLEVTLDQMIHHAAAVRLLEFLSGELAQKLYAAKNFEYPVKAGVEWDPLVASWGRFRADKINIVEIAKHRPDASKLVDKTGFDQARGGS